MPYGISVTSSVRRGVLTAIFIFSAGLLSINGCGRSADASHDAVAPGAGTAVGGDPSVASLGAPSTNPATVQYATSADAGQAIVSGTSTLHDWSVKSTVIKGIAEFSGQLKAGSATPVALTSINLVIPVDSLKSTEGSDMNNNTHNALKLKQFPTINYQLTKASLKSSPSKQGEAYHFDTTGQLNVAGAAHPVNLDLGVLPADNGKLTITTDVGLKMTDFGIKPPTAMLGVIKSGDAITVKVNWQLTMRPPTTTATK